MKSLNSPLSFSLASRVRLAENISAAELSAPLFRMAFSYFVRS